MRGTAKYQRLNSVGKDVYNERADCGVIAIAVMADVSYGKARAVLKRLGRKDRCGTKTQQLLDALKILTGQTWKTRVYSNANKHTVNKAVQYFREGDRALLLTHNHVCAMVDGVVHDWTQGRRHRVVSAITMDIHPPMPLRST